MLLGGCGSGGGTRPITIRLVDLYDDAVVEGYDGQGGHPLPRTEWRFDAPAPQAPAGKFGATGGWEAGLEVSDLAIRDGLLTGKTRGDFPILRVERSGRSEDRDLLHTVEVRMRASAGANLAVQFSGDETVDLAKVKEDAEVFPWLMTVPIIAGEETRTYTLTPPRPVNASGMRHLLLRPTDAPGAGFAIESVRVIFRKEHLAGVPSGIGWHGMSEIYRETLVSRSPETIRFSVTLPGRPWLDLGIGTIEDGPVTFRVGVSRNGGSAATEGREDSVVLERTLTTPHRWEEAPIDLAPYAGEKVTLSLSVRAENAGALGFWGSPAVRDLGAAAPHATGRGTSAPTTTAAWRGDGPQGVILIWADTLRRDSLDVYGYERPTAPAITRMARDGALFSDFLVNATWTKVSTPSLFTSLYPRSHGVVGFSDRLPAVATTLAEVYREAGYATLSLSSIVFTGKFTNLHQGFEQVYESGSVPDRLNSKTAREFVDRLLPWLEAHRDVPFFVFLHVSDPHDPFLPYPPYDTLWADPSWKEEHEADYKRARDAIKSPLLKRFGMPNRAELLAAGIDPDVYVSRERDWYDGSIRGMDAEIDRLLQHLRGLDLDRKTLVIFTSDHGEEFLEHGQMFHGQSVYGELANAPLVMWGPGVVPAGVVVDDTVQSIDVMPTLLDLSGFPAPDGIQGRSLVPLIFDRLGGGSQIARSRRAQQDPRSRPAQRDTHSPATQQVARSDGALHGAGLYAAEGNPVSRDQGHSVPAFIQKARTPGNEAAPPPWETESFAVVHDGWKLIHNTQRLEGAASPNEYELYDTRNDPLDQVDLAAQHGEIVERLSQLLKEWLDSAEAARLKPDSDQPDSLSHDELERLRSLGYIN